MKVIGLLSFFAEPPELLGPCIQALAKAGVDHLVALDGRYAMFKAKQDISPLGQHGLIHAVCQDAGMACTLSVPNGPWEGGEVEKRTALFALGWTVAQEGDWFWVQDADQIVTDCPTDWKERLAATEHDVAHVTLHDLVAAELDGDEWPADIEVRSFFRAQPIHLENSHCTYVAENGRKLWDMGVDEVPALDLSDIRVDHRPQDRSPERLAAKMQYYTERDASGVERGWCACGEKAVKLVARNWRVGVNGKGIADWYEACEAHAKRWEYEARWELKKIGQDPGSAAFADVRAGVHARNGAKPMTV